MLCYPTSSVFSFFSGSKKRVGTILKSNLSLFDVVIGETVNHLKAVTVYP